MEGGNNPVTAPLTAAGQYPWDVSLMPEDKVRRLVIWSKPFYFGWLLAFPFYGPALYAAVPVHATEVNSLATVFVVFHALAYGGGALWLKNCTRWYGLMKGSLLATLAAHLLLMVVPAGQFWLLAMAVMGVASSLYVLGWSCIFSLSGVIKKRMKAMAQIIGLANLILLTALLLSNLLPLHLLLAVLLLPLLASLVILLQFPEELQPFVVVPFASPRVSPRLLLIFAFLIFSLYLNGGFLYRIMIPAFYRGAPVVPYIPYVPYVAYLLALVVLYQYGKPVRRTMLIYLGIVLLGMSFIVYALASQFAAGTLLAIVLLEGAFVLLDIFLWTTLSTLAFIYGAPFLFFGTVLAANTASILTGDLIGVQIMQMVGNTYKLTALLSSGSIFLVILVVPWLNKVIDDKLYLIKPKNQREHSIPSDEPVERLICYLPAGEKLTEREREIVTLTLQGRTNKDMAKELFISEHTVRTHLRNICGKFGLSRKKELMQLAARNNRPAGQ